jgi:ribosomal protein S18 acetylase RimI-like enzyme
MEIKIGIPEDIEKIAICHRAAFPKSLSSALGLDYVKVMLMWYLSTEQTFLFYIEESGNCIGYCGGMIRKATGGYGSASSMAQFSFRAAVKGFLKKPWLLFHPEVRGKYRFIFRNIVNRFKKVTPNLNPGRRISNIEPTASLVVIGVKPAYQGKGYGSMLLQEFERITLERGLKKMLLSVRTDNVQAIKSYSKNGWITTQVNGMSTTMEKELK